MRIAHAQCTLLSMLCMFLALFDDQCVTFFTAFCCACETVHLVDAHNLFRICAENVVLKRFPPLSFSLNPKFRTSSFLWFHLNHMNRSHIWWSRSQINIVHFRTACRFKSSVIEIVRTQFSNYHLLLLSHS